MKFTGNNLVLKVLSLMLFVSALLKGWQLVTEPVANNDIWLYRPFLIFVVEFELALAIWLLSGVFKKAAWLTVLLCFCAFSCIKLYKGLDRRGLVALVSDVNYKFPQTTIISTVM
jgi:hypothetical protein